MDSQSDQFHFKSAHHSSNLCAGISELFSTELFSDIEIKVESQIFKCHKLVLSVMCPYFHTMFNTGLKERVEKQVVLQGISADIFKDVLMYIYCGVVNINGGNVQDLLQAADMYNIDELKYGCSMFYSANLNEDNCLAVWKLARHMNSEELASVAFDVATEKFQQVINKNEDFIEMDRDELLLYLGSENLKIDTEDQVLLAAIKWLEKDRERYNHLEKLLSVINLMDIQPETLQEKFITNNRIASNETVCDIIATILNHLRHNTSIISPISERIIRKHSTSTEKLAILGGSIQVTHSRYCTSECYIVNTNEKPSSSSVQKFCTLPTNTATAYLASSVIKDNIYISGLGEHSNEVWCYNVTCEKWIMCPTLITGRNSHDMIVGPNFKFYVLGGYNSLRALSSIEELDYKNNSNWKHIGNLVFGIGSFSTLYFQNALYVFGGKQDFQNATDVIQKFDFDTCTSSLLNIKLPTTCGSSQLVKCMNYAILACSSATVIIDLKQLNQISTTYSAKRTNDTDRGSLFTLKQKIDLQGFQMNVLGDDLYITGGESVSDDDINVYTCKVLKAKVSDILDLKNSHCEWSLSPIVLNQPLAYHISVVVKLKN